MTGAPERAAASAARLGAAAQGAGWRGSDPYDALWWRGWPAALLRRKRGRQLLIQLHARAPVDFRSLYRTGSPVNAKALALFGAAGARLSTTDAAAAAWSQDAFAHLVADTAAGDAAWGYPFPVQTRWSFYGADVPNIIATSFAAVALKQGGADLGRPDLTERANAAARWIRETLFAAEEGWFTYHPTSQALIHNANLLGARAVHAVGEAGDDAVRRAVAVSLSAQRPDGSFPYGDTGGLGWVDSFHTGYVLDCLLDLTDVDPGVERALRTGAQHYAERFFGPRGQARLWPDREWPEDGHSAGTATGVLARLAKAGFIDWELADRVAARTVDSMVRGDHAVHRRWRVGSSRVDYIRWCDAHVAHGLAVYAALRG